CGQTRRTAALRTQGTRSSARRSSSIGAAKKFPPAWRAMTASSSARGASTTLVQSSIARNGKSGECASQYALAAPSASVAKPTTKPAAARSRRPLADMRTLQDLRAKVLVGDANGARRHRHERVVRHPRRGVDLQQVRLAALVEHQVDAPPALTAERLEGLQAHCLDLLFLRLG